MNEEKRGNQKPLVGNTAQQQKSSHPARARNRTVVLTPEAAVKMRNMFAQGNSENTEPQIDEIMPGLGWENTETKKGNFVKPADEPLPSIVSGENEEEVKPKRQRVGSTSRIDRSIVKEALAEAKNKVLPPLDPHLPAKQEVPYSTGFQRPVKQEKKPERFEPIIQSTAFESSVLPDFAKANNQQQQDVKLDRNGSTKQRLPRIDQNQKGDIHSTQNVAHHAPIFESAKTVQPKLQSTAETRIVGFLVSYDNNPHGEIIELRVGRWIVSSRPNENNNMILIEDNTVSPLHAIIKITDDAKIQVLDQMSEFGTARIRENSEEIEDLSGALCIVENGDIIKFGERTFAVALLPKKLFV